MSYAIVLQALQNNIISDYSPNLPISYYIRSFSFQGITSQIVVFKKPADGCLKIIRSDDYIDKTQKQESLEFWKSATPLSNLSQIITNPQKPVVLPKKYFGKENIDQWCYFYEKADLSRQQSKWKEAIDYYTQAKENNFTPNNTNEWVPLIEAYAFTSQVQKASDISNNLELDKASVKSIICYTWNNFESKITNSKDNELIKNTIANLQCQNEY